MAMSLPSRLPDIGTTIFSTMSALAARHGAVNLGQGFPDFDCDPALIEAVSRAMRAGHNQYPPMPGWPALRQAVARKIADLRLLEDELSVTDAGAPVLVVSQFTLYADTRKGRRPTWNKAAPGEVAEPLVEAVAEDLRGRGLEVATGRFGADMKIDMEADGPVTILIEAE